jgi:hypothetical protein
MQADIFQPGIKGALTFLCLTVSLGGPVPATAGWGGMDRRPSTMHRRDGFAAYCRPRMHRLMTKGERAK